MSLTFWYWAARQAAHLYTMQVLNISWPGDAPTVGNRVLIVKPPKEEHAFESRMEEVLLVCWDPTTIQ
eukprot:12896085-Prorocentrum_lima.AAC.1